MTWGSQSWLQPPFEAAPRATTEPDLVVAKPRLRPPDVTGLSESMRKLHEPCGARLVADVAHALLRAVSRLSRNPGLNPCFQKNCWNEVSAARDVPNRERSLLISTPALLFDTVCESSARTGRQEESEARL